MAAVVHRNCQPGHRLFAAAGPSALSTWFACASCCCRCSAWYRRLAHHCPPPGGSSGRLTAQPHATSSHPTASQQHQVKHQTQEAAVLSHHPHQARSTKKLQNQLQHHSRIQHQQERLRCSQKYRWAQHLGMCRFRHQHSRQQQQKQKRRRRQRHQGCAPQQGACRAAWAHCSCSTFWNLRAHRTRQHDVVCLVPWMLSSC